MRKTAYITKLAIFLNEENCLHHQVRIHGVGYFMEIFNPLGIEVRVSAPFSPSLTSAHKVIVVACWALNFVGVPQTKSMQ